jgi:hypothetical protein
MRDSKKTRMAMSAARANITATTPVAIDVFGVFLETGRSARLNGTGRWRRDVIFNLSILHKRALLNCDATFRLEREHKLSEYLVGWKGA